MIKVIFGYRYHEVNLSDPLATDKSLKLVEYEPSHGRMRKPMAVSLGATVKAACLYYPDVTHQESAMMGVMKRIATLMPSINIALYDQFLEFSKFYINKWFQDCILEPECDLSVETWLETTNYTSKRKQQLINISEERQIPRNGDLFVKSHIKYEPYVEPKHFRGIYSRSDFFKTYVGPICAAFGKRLFKHIFFIKNIPVKDRAGNIYVRFNGVGIWLSSNDFTSFEATFVAKLMEIECYWFEFVTQNISDERFRMFMRKIKTGRNRIIFRKFVMTLIAKRYSGEMDTSSMNSLFNLLIIAFMLFKGGEFKFGEDIPIPPFVEGDDSLIASVNVLEVDVLKELGCNAKIVTHESAFDASFCGMVFDPDVRDIITSPMPAMLSFGYTSPYHLYYSKRKLDALLRAKSLSMLYTFPGCPILTSLAKYGLRVTDHISDRAMHSSSAMLDKWKQSVFKEAVLFGIVVGTPHIKTRMLMEKLYNVPIESQLQIEQYLDSLEIISEIDCPAIQNLMPQLYYDAFDKYSGQIHLKDPYGC